MYIELNNNIGLLNIILALIYNIYDNCEKIYDVESENFELPTHNHHQVGQLNWIVEC